MTMHALIREFMAIIHNMLDIFQRISRLGNWSPELTAAVKLFAEGANRNLYNINKIYTGDRDHNHPSRAGVFRSKVYAIKYFRDKTGLPLKDCKEFVEAADKLISDLYFKEAEFYEKNVVQIFMHSQSPETDAVYSRYEKSKRNRAHAILSRLEDFIENERQT